jgi:opacity protein-like surface antigen
MNRMLATIALGAAIITGTSAAHANTDALRSDRTGIYLGANLGSSLDSDSRITLGAAAGYQLHRNLRLEVAYDNLRLQSGNGHMLSANVVPQYRIPRSTVTVYGLAGAGIGWDRWGIGGTGSATTSYVVGAGVRVAVSERVELDARYRFVNPFDRGQGLVDTQIGTVGVAYRF